MPLHALAMQKCGLCTVPGSGSVSHAASCVSAGASALLASALGGNAIGARGPMHQFSASKCRLFLPLFQVLTFVGSVEGTRRMQRCGFEWFQMFRMILLPMLPMLPRYEVMGRKPPPTTSSHESAFARNRMKSVTRDDQGPAQRSKGRTPG